MGSNTRINAHRLAHIRLADGACKGPFDFLLTNKNHDTGNSNIIIEGGIWDYNCSGNPRKPDLFDLSGPSGTMLEFRKVNNLILSGLTLRDPECYYTRFCEVEDFIVEDIDFVSRNIRPNQDGVHLCGFCKNGIVRNLRASPDSPNDDFVAINADDCMTRLQNQNTLCGPIENIAVYNVCASNCLTFIRMASLVSPIRNIDISGIKGGCRTFVVNMDALRYCRTPLFRNEDRPEGVGNVENVRISDVYTYSTRPGKGLFCLETNVRNFHIRNFRYDFANAYVPHNPAAFIGNLGHTEIKLWETSGTESKFTQFNIKPGESLVVPPEDFNELRLDGTIKLE
jgi:hypothetical protein